jgi:hypothetical protein
VRHAKYDCDMNKRRSTVTIKAPIGEQERREQRAQAMRQAVAEYEAEHGEITVDEMEKQAEADRDAANKWASRRT